MGENRFLHESHFQRVHFARADAANALTSEIERLAASRVMVIASISKYEIVKQLTRNLPVVRHYHDIARHIPLPVAERARSAAATCQADALVAIGGGSATGLAKAIALTTGLPIIALPTTYAGSEATAVWGLTEGNRKTTGSNIRVVPQSIIYDATLTVTLPVPDSIASGFNALAHCIDSMWGPRADPIDRMYAAEGIRALSRSIVAVAADGMDLNAREEALYGTYLSAVAFSSAGSGLHHKICHVLGGAFDLPHAQTHAVVLPHVLAYNAPAAPVAERQMAAAFGSESALIGLEQLRRSVDAPRALRDYGLSEADIDTVIPDILDHAPSDNPRPVTFGSMQALLNAALNGDDPHVPSEEEARHGRL
ncbi:maleylacetate reductase [Rhodococcus erythropolis]|uniref:maleylacetate reductase n=1 Tax=Rhodococcus erythropolis TaxID=1833 RepID=UPI0029496A50|nr:maleylacetate reductase [Rhodococcus erythropolis]MDV6212709.1 maleylacetate reductase [Rhodococcus erythropolis]